MKTIICHRGVNRRDENSLSSIVGVGSLENIDGIRYGVEFDLQVTKDGCIVCYHDDTLERLHGFTDNISSLTRDDIIRLNIPFFEDIAYGLVDGDSLIDVEFKTVDIDRVHYMCKSVFDICVRLNILKRCIFTSFDSHVVEYFLKLNAKYESDIVDIAIILYEVYDAPLVNKLYILE